MEELGYRHAPASVNIMKTCPPLSTLNFTNYTQEDFGAQIKANEMQLCDEEMSGISSIWLQCLRAILQKTMSNWSTKFVKVPSIFFVHC